MTPVILEHANKNLNTPFFHPLTSRQQIFNDEVAVAAETDAR